MKNKHVAAVLALFLGIWGVHRFYLGKRFWGVLHLLLFFITLAISIEENAPFVMIPAILGFIDAVLLFAMPQEEFDERYNQKYLYGAPVRYEAPYQDEISRRKEAAQLKRKGIQRFRAQDYEGAIDLFERILDIDYEDQAAHFNLACCYSMLEEEDNALLYLDKAVEFGFRKMEKIHSHPALVYLRSRKVFGDFVRNGYRKPQPLPQPEENHLDSKTQSEDLLEQIVKLGELRERGILTEEEFAMQKKKLLR
jgi:tetratricopeptide (TPR) repeat protein